MSRSRRSWRSPSERVVQNLDVSDAGHGKQFQRDAYDEMQLSFLRFARELLANSSDIAIHETLGERTRVLSHLILLHEAGARSTSGVSPTSLKMRATSSSVSVLHSA